MRSLPRILPLLLVLSLAAPTASLEAGSAGRISGKVKAPDGTGLLDAVVTIFKQDPSGGTISFTRSDKWGAYAIGNLIPGLYYLQVSREGYQPLTQGDVKIDSGRTTTLDVILDEFLDLIVADPDPRNWDIKTLMRSTSDRRLIFRYLQATGETPSGNRNSAPLGGDSFWAPGNFVRSGTVNVSSSAGLSSQNYSVFPTNGHNGVLSNFAFTEPLGDSARMVFSGQINSGYDSLWRVRNTFDYRPEPGRDMKVYVGYGRLSLNSPPMASVGRPAEFFAQDPSLRESGAQTLALGLEARARILDPIEIEYGFDYSRVYYGATKGVFSPLFRLVITPADTWTIKAGMSSRRVSDNNTVYLPDGDSINLMEPTYLAQIGGELHLSQFKHYEISIAKNLTHDTDVELAVYEDSMEGPGTPFLVTRESGLGLQSRVAQLREDQAYQRGLRVAMHRRFLDFLSGSIAYVYGSGAHLANPGEPLAGDVLAYRLLDYVQRSYYHVFTSQVDAEFPKTRTQVTSIVRWHPGYTLNPIDLFSDRKDTLTKGVNFFVRQGIPLPEFMETVGRWEALVDVRNLLDNGKNRIRTGDGDLILTRNPRSVRFGLNLNFY